MKLATWNVNALADRLPRVLELLERHEPDVVCLQETRTDGERFPVGELGAAGYGAVHHSAGPRAGVAILAREGLAFADVAKGVQGQPDPSEARWLEATVGGLRVASVDVASGEAVGSAPYDDKLLVLDAAKARALALRELGLPTVLAGDFNVAPTDADVYDPDAFEHATHVTEEERRRLRELLAAGYADAHLAVNGEGAAAPTWWDERRGHFGLDHGLRIDLALVSQDVRVVACEVDRELRRGERPSDHAPVLVELELPD